MKIQTDEIYKIALQYFPRDSIDKFIKLISGWESQTKSSFFQVTQSGANLQMEFGALIGEAIFDITMTKDSTKIIEIPLSTVTSIFLDDGEDFTTLSISAGGQWQSMYRAVLEKSRTELKEYARILHQVIILKKN